MCASIDAQLGLRAAPSQTLGVLLFGAVALAFALLNARNSAQAAQRRAETQAQIATSRLLAARARLQLNLDPLEALGLARKAMRVHPTAEARDALRAGLVDAPLYQIRVQAGGAGGWSTRATFSPDGRLVVARAGAKLRIWAPRSGEPVAVLALRDPDHTYETAALFDNNGALLATDDARGTVVWNRSTWTPRKTFPGEKPLAFSPDGGELVFARAKGKGLIVRDTRTWHEVAWPDPTGQRSVDIVFITDGKHIVTLSHEFEAASTRVTVRSSSGRIVRVSFDVSGYWSDPMLSRNGRFVALVHSLGLAKPTDRSVAIWRLSDGTRVLFRRAGTLRTDLQRGVRQRPDGLARRV